MKNLKIRTKLVLGFGLMLMLMLGTLVGVKLQINKQNTITNRTMNLRASTIQTSLELLNGMNQSLAGLRGWLLLGDPTFQEDRAQAWRIMDERVAKMETLSQSWTDPANITRFEEIKEILVEFRTAQQAIDDIANTPGNLPATEILLTDAAPRAEIIINAITEMIDLELARPRSGDDRIKILGSMANFRGSMAMSLANVRAYLLSGDPAFVTQYDRFAKIRQTSQRELEMVASSLNPAQRAAFNTLTETMKEFEPLPPQMFKVRGSEGWNQANAMLAKDATPRAAQLLTLAESMVESQTGLMEADKRELANSIDTTNLITIVLFLVSLAVAAVLSLSITISIVGPVVELTGAATQISVGEHINEPLKIDSGGEVGELAKALERLRASVVVLTEMASSRDLDDGLDDLDDDLDDLDL